MQPYKFEYVVDGVKRVETDYYLETMFSVRKRISEKYGIPENDMPIYQKLYLSDRWMLIAGKGKRMIQS